MELSNEKLYSNFNLEEIKDRATFAEPAFAPKGIKYILVNGEIAVRDNKIERMDLGGFPKA